MSLSIVIDSNVRTTLSSRITNTTIKYYSNNFHLIVQTFGFCPQTQSCSTGFLQGWLSFLNFIFLSHIICSIFCCFHSIGIAIPSLFSFHSSREKLRALQLNTHQLSKTLTANGHLIDSMWERQHAYKLHSDWLKSAANQNIKNLETMAGKVAKQYILALEKMSSHMTASLSSYDLHAMIYGIAILVQTLCWVVGGLFRLSNQKKEEDFLDVSVTSVFVVSGAVLLVAVLHLSACSSIVIGKRKQLN